MLKDEGCCLEEKGTFDLGLGAQKNLYSRNGYSTCQKRHKQSLGEKEIYGRLREQKMYPILAEAKDTGNHI